MALEYVNDSRRLTGRTIVLARPGALLEVTPPADRARRLIALWKRAARKLVDALGWRGYEVEARYFAPTGHLGVEAPIDLLMVATYVNEWAWELALARVEGPRAMPSLAAIVARLQARIARSERPALRRFHAIAVRRRAQVLIGESDISAGEGDSAETFAFDAMPDIRAIDWRTKRHRVPTALVTGTNGKTTTVRLLARMLAEDGRAVGFCCTDSVEVAGEVLDRDDWSGPGGTRRVLRHPGTGAAVLEVARGGMLRRGLAVRDAEVAIVTNVANDHVHDMGIHSLEQMAEVKFLIAAGLAPRAPLVTHWDDQRCRRRALALKRPLIFFAERAPTAARLARLTDVRGFAAIDDGRMIVTRRRQRLDLGAIASMPLALGGAARFNVLNALAASAAALVLGVEADAIRRALGRFGASNDDNPGRGNRYRINGATVIADFGHNPQALAAVFAIARALPHRRLLISLGQGGDRDDAAIIELGALAAAERPDRVIVKDMAKYRRGRALGEMPALFRRGLVAGGVPAAAIEEVDGDLGALALALAWLKPGDLAVLFVHEDSDRVLAELAARESGSTANTGVDPDQDRLSCG